jgi:hypothetical protein
MPRPIAPPRSRSRALAVIFAAGATVAAAFSLSAGCSYSGDANGPPILKPLDSGDGTEIFLDVLPGDDSVPSLSAFCGVMKKCVPDDPSECLLVDGGRPDVGAGDDVDGALDGSATKLGCRVVRGSSNVESACAPAGIAPESSFCSSDADCAPGLACVGAGGTGICLRFCCKAASPSDPICPSTHYCVPLLLAARPVDKVPVCAKLDNCTLLEDPSSKCTAGKSSCTVVRNDGGTTCVPIGAGGECDDCTISGCQANFACVGSADNRRCRKLCHAGSDSECDSKRCESVSTIPTGFGLCAVGSDAGACK